MISSGVFRNTGFRVDTLNSLERETKTHYGILNFERRKYPRFTVDLPVEYYRIDKTGGSCGRALDISQSGLLIYFPERVEIGQCLRLKLYMSFDSKLKVIEMIAEVVWMDTLLLKKDWGDYRIGVKFVDISPADMTELEHFLINLSR